MALFFRTTATKTLFAIQKIVDDWNSVKKEYWEIMNADPAYMDAYTALSLTLEETGSFTGILMKLTTTLD